MTRSSSVATLLALAATLAAPVAGAQEVPARAAASRRPPRLAVATNPLAIPFGVFTLDVEAATRVPGLTFGVGGTLIANDRDLGWADARVMYFPGEVPLRGFALGLTGGLVHEKGDPTTTTCIGDEGCAAERTETAPTLGVRVDYDWLVGARKRMLVGLGVGAKRTLRDRTPGSPLDEVYGDGRFVVGLVF